MEVLLTLLWQVLLALLCVASILLAAILVVAFAIALFRAVKEGIAEAKKRGGAA